MLLTQLQFDTRAHYLPLIGILWLFGLFAEEQTTIQAETKRIKSKLLFGSRIEYAHADKHCPPTNDRSSIAKDLFESVRC
ncbi:Coenzyme F420H(2) oxidase [Trichinella pseudospiralis]